MNPFFAFCNIGFKTTMRLFGDQQIEGKENVPKTGPLIFISNHLSNLDPAIVASITGRNPGFLAKKELFKFPLFAFLLRAYGAHPLNRGTSDMRALRWAMNRLSTDDSALILFPEGTRNRDGSGMRKGLSGVTHIAIKTKATIVPVGITGTEPFQNVLKVFAPIGHSTITIGKPFRVAGEIEERLSREQLEEMTTEIMVHIARLLPESYRGHYRDLADIRFKYTEEVE